MDYYLCTLSVLNSNWNRFFHVILRGNVLIWLKKKKTYSGYIDFKTRATIFNAIYEILRIVRTLLFFN